jgi:methyl-accepting chemotaxis protein
MYAAEKADAAMLDEAKTEVHDYGGAFRDAVLAQDKLELPPSVRSALDGVALPLDAYITKAGAGLPPLKWSIHWDRIYPV